MQDTGIITKLFSRFMLGQPGAFWVALLLIFFIAWNKDKLKNRLNLSLFLLILPALPLLDIVTWVTRVEISKQSDTQARILLDIAFASLFMVTAFMAGWSFLMSRGRNVLDWQPNVSLNTLKILFLIVLAMDLALVIGHMPDDAGWYTNIGAKRWLETGTMPYADAFLKGPDSPAHGAAATYGPLLYLMHIPFQFLTGVNLNPADMNPKDPAYSLPPVLATQLTCLFFHLIGLWALYKIGEKIKDQSLGFILVILYAGSAYILGLGSNITSGTSDTELAGGLVYISHIAPTAVLLLALYHLERPYISGFFLALAAGVLFFPVFFFPLFFGWHFWNNRKSAIQFTIGFAIAGSMIALMVIVFTGSLDGKGPIKLLLESTLEHQEGFSADQYGMSPFSFWGNFPSLSAFWQKPLIGETSIFKPTFLLFISYSIAMIYLSKKRTLQEFALLMASLAAALQLWKTHAAGTYVEWYFPFLLIGLLGRSRKWATEKESAIP